MRCVACETDKPPGEFTNSQRKRPSASRKCTACVGATGHAVGTRAVDTGGGGAAVAAEPQTPDVLPPPATAKVCAWSGCGRELSTDAAEQSKFRCGRCKQAFYCSRTCQKRHWGRGGHKEDCKEPPCCTICLDGGDDPVPIQRGCACRGDAGLAHVACLVKVAARKAGGCHEGWFECPTCGQYYTGAMDLGLQRALVHRMHTRPRHDYERLGAEGNLGNALMDAGQLAEAADVLARVFTVMKRVYGEEDEQTLNTAGTLAVTYQQQGRLDEAEELQVWVAAARTRLDGKEHPGTLDATTNLAATYSDQGKLAEAEELQVAVLEARTRLQGKEHPRTLNAATNLAATYTMQGKHAEAEALQAGLLAVHRRVLGAEHPGTLHTAADLAFTYNKQGRLVEAEALYVEVLVVSQRVRGAAYPDTLDVARNVARMYDFQGRGADAEELSALYRL